MVDDYELIKCVYRINVNDKIITEEYDLNHLYLQHGDQFYMSIYININKEDVSNLIFKIIDIIYYCRDGTELIGRQIDEPDINFNENELELKIKIGID